MIYAIQILDGKFVKIGFSASETTQSRIASMQTGCPFEITEIFTVDGTIRQEKEIHKTLLCAFAKIKVPVPPNEWYPGQNPVFVGFLKALEISANQGISYCDEIVRKFERPGEKTVFDEPNIKWPKLKKWHPVYDDHGKMIDAVIGRGQWK